MGVRSEYIWFDGQLVPYADAKVHVLTHTLHYGLGVFEGIRAYAQPDGAAGVWRLKEHLQRFLDSIRMCHMPTCPHSLDDLMAAVAETLRANKMTEGYIRPLAFLGDGAMGLGARNNPLHVVIAVWEWGSYLGDDGVAHGVRVKTSTMVRHHPNATLQRAKVVGHYVNNILARYEANDDGYDEAIMLDHQGHVAEGTGENLFIVEQNGRVLTPPGINILPGITRQTIIDLCALDGITVVEQLFGRDALYVADEVFMVGTAAEVTPIKSVDRLPITYSPGPFTKRMQTRYDDAIHGRIPEMTKYITVC
jgi:branched-chain amino acid aminotransferase